MIVEFCLQSQCFPSVVLQLSTHRLFLFIILVFFKLHGVCQIMNTKLQSMNILIVVVVGQYRELNILRFSQQFYPISMW